MAPGPSQLKRPRDNEAKARLLRLAMQRTSHTKAGAVASLCCARRVDSGVQLSFGGAHVQSAVGE